MKESETTKPLTKNLDFAVYAEKDVLKERR